MKHFVYTHNNVYISIINNLRDYTFFHHLCFTSPKSGVFLFIFGENYTMKKIVIIVSLLSFGFIFSQSGKDSSGEMFFKMKKVADSLGVQYQETNEYLENIDIISDFKDRLLVNNSFKNAKKCNNIIQEFKAYYSFTSNSKILCKSESAIISFYRLEVTKNYTKAYVIVRNKVVSHLEKNIEDSEIELIKILRKANYPVEKFNKLSDRGKREVLEKIDSGYVYP